MSEPGTAPMVGFAALMHTLGPGRAIGGSGSLTEALVRRIRHDGATVSPADGAEEISRDGDDWIVRTASGRELLCRNVIAGCHVLTTLDLLTPGTLSERTRDKWRNGIRVGPGIGMVVRVATARLPHFASVADPTDTVGLGLLVTDRAQLQRAHSDALAGRLPEQPCVVSMGFSAVDSSICPPGQHQLSLWAQWHPYRLREHRWSEVADRSADSVVAEIDRYAPGFRETVLDRHVQTPDTLESELGLIGGNVMHVEMSLDQMMLFRPRPELAGYRVPGLRGLYLTGASTHPGGGVSGASGRNVARLVLGERRYRRWPT